MSTILQHLRVFASRMHSLWRRDRLHAHLADEMRFHEEMLALDLERDGGTRGDARMSAQRKFGNALALRERSADAWGFPSLEQLWQDVRYGARMLRRNPGFAVIAIAAIGLAIGVNAGFFTLVDAFMWQPIPVARPDRLVKLLSVDSHGATSIRFSYPELTTLAARSRTVDDIVAYFAVPVAVRASAAGRAAAASAALVSGNYFSALGGSAQRGRPLAALDDRDDSPPVVVISDGFWSRELARAPDVVGRDILVNGSHATIVGVARADFIGINPLVPDFWVTLRHASAIGATPGRLLDPANRFIALHARLHPGIGLQQAEAELSGMIAEPAATTGSRAELARVVGARLMPNSSIVPSDSETALMVAPALLVVALVLIIACANLANLLLARALVRHREIAVRLALGASRQRLVRQLLTESLLIAVAGAVLGLVLANWTVTLTSRSFFSMVPTTLGTLAFSLHASWHVVAYTMALVLVSVVTFGLAPALQATSPSLTSALKGEDTLFGTRMRRSRVRDWLVVVQVAGAVVLLVASATLAKSVQSFVKDDTGLEAGRVTVATLGLSVDGHVPQALTDARMRFATRVAALPGVTFAARALLPPFASWPLVHLAAADDRGETRVLPVNRITPSYFDVVGQRIVEGRRFATDDSGTASVAIISVRAARRLWPTGSAIGRSIRMVSNGDANDRIVRIVGVVSDAHSGMIWDWDGNGYVYLPATTADLSTSAMPLIIRTSASDPALVRALGDIAQSVDPNAPLHTDPLAAVRDFQIEPYRYGAAITSGVGAIGLGLALIGLYGVVAFAVRQRQRDVAVHVAMGANRRDVLRLVLRREMTLVLIGLGTGLVLATGESQLIGALTLSLTPLGVAGFAAIILMLLAIATLATTIPALAALKIAPMQVLRQD